MALKVGLGFSTIRRPLGLFLLALLVLALMGTGLFASGCREKEVSLEYEPRPDLALVTVESDGGLPYPGDDLQPLFQLWGDGSFIAYDEESGVFVQGKVDEAAIADLLQQIADAGFFDLEDEYIDPDIYDATWRLIAVDLEETQKTVTVGMTMDVPEFDAAYELILDYPLGEATEYVPEQGYLVVAKYPKMEGDEYSFLDPNGEIYKLLPDTGTLNAAADSHTAVAVDGADFIQLKKYETGQEPRGLYISQPDGTLVVYPVYEPRTADKP